MINERLNQLRTKMREHNMQYYYIPTADFHNSEYVGDYFKARQFMSDFTGSAGVMVVSMDEACLWTDGRYFIQAEKQMADNEIKLMKMLEPGVPTVSEYLASKMKENETLGFDGRVVMSKQKEEWEKVLETKKVHFSMEHDLVDEIWENRPALSDKKAYLLDLKYCGKSVQDKLSDIRQIMQEKKAAYHLVTTLDDIAWIFNMRGSDVHCSPVVLAYALIDQQKVQLFMDESKLTDELKAEFAKNQIQVCEYNQVYEQVKTLKESVMLDKNKVNAALMNQLDCEIINCANPSYLMKAIKNETELKNTRNAHIKDGVAVTKFMIWLKQIVKEKTISEFDAANYLLDLRKAQEGFIDLSFDTIAAYGANAASMHYTATAEKHALLKDSGMLLVDSGGTYFDGTTDITRTYILGEISDEMKLHYTTVLKSMLDLSMAQFLHGCTGINLDILARGPLWKLGIDYKCGTGHGVGHVLNVHEGPQGFRWRFIPEKDDSCVIEEGMITTNEPGVYIEGSHGIRIENEMISKTAFTNESGTFMNFETITMSPIDLDGIMVELLSEEERTFLNQYHQQVYTHIAPYLNENEKAMLKVYTRAI